MVKYMRLCCTTLKKFKINCDCLLPENKKGDKVEFKNVLLVSGDKPKLGAPYLKGVSVSAKVLKNGKQKKVIIFKYKDKNNDARKQGHRQPYTLVKIESINLPA